MTATKKENQRQNGHSNIKEEDWDIKMDRTRQELLAVVERSATKAAQTVQGHEDVEEMDANGQGKILFGIDDEFTPVRYAMLYYNISCALNKEHLSF
jgi:hypothetical protein